MNTIWSRAAPVQFPCRSRFLQPAHAVIRRSATRAPRRRVTVADLFTACYTTILGAATLLDASHKNQRRELLDKQLARARSSLAAQGKSAPEEPRSFLEMDDLELAALEKEYWRTPKRIPVPTYVMNRLGYDAVFPFVEEFRDVYKIKHPPIGQHTWLQNQMDWVNIEVNMAAEAQIADNEPRKKPMNSFEIAETTRAVLLLIQKLLSRVEAADSPRTQDKALNPVHVARTDEILEQVDQLRHGLVYPKYENPGINPPYSTQVHSLLHHSLRRIFNRALSTRETVGRISHNLLVTPVPPSMHTYNILIAGFNRIQRPDLAQEVIDSFVKLLPWKPTEQTVSALLTHYRAPGYRKGLRDTVQRLRGRLVRDLQPTSLVSKRSPNYQARKAKGYSEYEQIRKIKRSDQTFDNIIRSWLYHKEVGYACMTFVACMRKHASIPISTLHELLKACLVTANFSNSRKMLVGILQHLDYFSRYISWLMDSSTTTAVLGVLRSLHHLVETSWIPFGEIYGVTYQTYLIESQSLSLLISRWKAEVELKEAAQIRRLVDEALLSSGSLVSRVEKAIAHVDKALSSRQIVEPFEKAYSTMAGLVSIWRRFLDLQTRTHDLELETKAALIRYHTGYNLDEREILLSNSVLNSTMMVRRLSLRRALRDLEIRPDGVQMYDIKTQLFRGIPNPDLVRQLEENYNWKRLGVQTLIFFYRRDVVRPRPEEPSRDPLLHQLEQQIQAVEDSIRAILFTFLNSRRQRAAMWYYRNYYAIPLNKLIDFVITDCTALMDVKEKPPHTGLRGYSWTGDELVPYWDEERVYGSLMGVSPTARRSRRKMEDEDMSGALQIWPISHEEVVADAPQVWPIESEDNPPLQEQGRG